MPAPAASHASHAVATTRGASIQGRDLVVHDGLLAATEIARYHALLHQAPFTRTEFARPDTRAHRHWVSEMAVQALQRLPLWQATAHAVRALRPHETYRAYRAYTNHAAYGDVLPIHTDALPGARELTALWFVCERWDPDWGGETLFFDDGDDARHVVSPRPGRLVLFDGAIRHAGRPPNRNCYVPRYTLAIKLEVAG